MPLLHLPQAAPVGPPQNVQGQESMVEKQQPWWIQ